LHVRSCEWGMVTCVMRLHDDHSCHMYDTCGYHIFIRHTYAFISGFTYMYHTCHVCHTCVTCVSHMCLMYHPCDYRLCDTYDTPDAVSDWESLQTLFILLLLPLLFLRKLARFPSMCSLDLLESTLMLIITFREIIKTSTVCNQRNQELENGKQNWHTRFRIAKLQEP